MSANAETEGTGTSSKGAGGAVREAFSALPFGEKISTLIGIELDLVGDAADAVFNAVSKVADEVVDAFTGCEPSQSTQRQGPDQQSAAN